MSAGAGDGPAGLIGAVGPRAGERLRTIAARSGARLRAEGELTLAVPGESVVGVRTAPVAAWLLGDLHPAPGAPQPLGERLTRLAGRLAAGAVGAASVAGELRGHLLLIAHDTERRATWILRDPIGARPLHYARRGEELMFAEHLADLIALLERTPAPDRGAVVMWIAMRALTPGRTLFTGISRLSAGQALEVTGGRARAVRVWEPRFREPEQLGRSALATVVADAALGAVARAAEPSRHPGVQLSGGLDSACVAAGLSAGAPGRGLALGLTFPDYPMVDESALMTQSAQAAGLELVCLPYREASLTEPMRSYSARWRLPAASPNLALSAPLLAAARERSVDRLLDGEGGDEMFGVWPPLIADRLWRGEVRGAWALVSDLPRHGPLPGRRRRLGQLRHHGLRAGLPSPIAGMLDRIEVARDAVERRLVMGRDLRGLLDDATDDPWAPLAGPHWWRAAVSGLVGRGDLLDAAGMLAISAAEGGVAARHPFMHDVTLLETILALPPAAGFQGRRDRGALRDGLAGRIPDAVRERLVKSYFNEISARRLDGPDGAALCRALLAPDAPILEFVRASGLRRVALAPAQTGRERYRRAAWLFRLGAVDTWLRTLESPRLP